MQVLLVQVLGKCRYCYCRYWENVGTVTVDTGKMQVLGKCRHWENVGTVTVGTGKMLGTVTVDTGKMLGTGTGKM